MTTPRHRLVNKWREDSHVARYLGTADTIPHRREGEMVLLELLPPRVARVLDVGTGDGRLLGLVRLVHGDAEGVAVDFSPAMLDAARTRFADDDDVVVIEHDLDQSLDPSWGRFDLVVSSFAIHHVVDARKRELYREVFALLEPGGLFVNLEHVSSPSDALHEAFLAEMGTDPADDDPSNQLAAIEPQLQWWRDIGFVDVDCFWKWRELALMGGTRPRLP